MSDLSFIDKLDEEQRQNLDMIITKAEKAGVDPRLAAVLAFNESGLRQNKIGDAGEIGIMQIKPSTAKLVGFDEKQIKSLDSNIDAGLTYLKQNIERFKDPVLGAMAYNTGPDHPFFHGKGEPSEQGLQYVNKIQSLGGFTPTPTKEEEGTQGESSAPPTPASEEDYRALKAAGLGAGAGALVGETLKIGKGVVDTARAVKDLPAAIREAAVLREGAPIPTEAQHTRQMQGTSQEGATGRARMQTFNERTAQEAAARKEAEATMRRLKQLGVLTGENPIAKAAGVTSTPSGVLLPAGAVYEPATPPAPPKPSPLQVAGRGAKNFAGAVLKSPVMSGALAGAGAGFGAQEASERYQKKDKIGAAIAGAGALGSAASMIPTLPTRVIGGGLAMASPAALVLLDRMRKATPEQTQRMLTNVDPMGNPLP